MMIELQSVTKLYGTVIGVNEITLSLAPGAYGLLGPNGSGKTTLLNLITGQLRPTIGRVTVMGQSPWNRDDLLRQIGLCPAVDVLYPNVSAFEWVSYLVELHGISRVDAAEAAAMALDQVGMSGAMNRPMGTYSLGMRQRTKLAQAFAHQPKLLILDEPFNGLDPIGRHEMTMVLRDWIRNGRSLILASHILHEVEAISPSFLLIRGGRLLASGTPDEVHTMLAEVPNEIRIRCDKPRELSQLLVAEGLVDSLRVDDDGQSIVAATRNPRSVYEQLPKWIDRLDLHVHEMRSGDDSLHNLFSSLMRMHRGEL
jgi:ABC-2 type transport system ATP-binding protein